MVTYHRRVFAYALPIPIAIGLFIWNHGDDNKEKAKDVGMGAQRDKLSGWNLDGFSDGFTQDVSASGNANVDQGQLVGPRGLRETIRSEPRDVIWASEIEQKLQSGYANIPGLRVSDQPVRVSCATSICEVSGGFSKAGANFYVNRAMADIQTQTSSFADERLGFASGATVAFGVSQTDPNMINFTTYFRRVR